MTEYAWFDLGDGHEVYRRVDDASPSKRSHLATPMIVSDTMEATQHPCDDKFYTSKAAFRATTRAHGCIEVGNDPARLRPRQQRLPDRQAIRASLKKAKAAAQAR